MCSSVEIKCQLDATYDFYCRSYCLLNTFQAPLCHYAAAARKPDAQPSAPHHTDNLKTEAPNTTGSNHLYNTLVLLMMGILVPETCWASNKICNKNHMLHLVGILFPHINGDAHSKPHQIYRVILLPMNHVPRNKMFWFDMLANLKVTWLAEHLPNI